MDYTRYSNFGSPSLMIEENTTETTFNKKFIKDRSSLSRDIEKLNLPIVYEEAQFIFQNIYLGSILAANDRQWLIDNGITHILGMVDGQVRYPDISYLVFDDVLDSPIQNIIKYFSKAFKFIDESFSREGRVLIHCHAGISRSTSVVLAYLMYKYGMCLNQAYGITKSSRPIVNPNYGFFLQLRTFGELTPEERKIFVSY